MAGQPLAKMGRLAFREEGKNWCAYYALENSMDGAILIGSILRKFVNSKERKEAFMDLMRECFGDMCEDLFGTRPTWGGPVTAPPHERSGSV